MACAPSLMSPPNCLLFQHHEVEKEKGPIPPALASAAHTAARRRARTTSGFALADMNGIRPIREECAPPVFTSGPRVSVFLCSRWSRHSDWYAH